MSSHSGRCSTTSWLIRNCLWSKPPSGISATCRSGNQTPMSISGGIWQSWAIARCGRKCLGFRGNASWSIIPSIKSSTGSLSSTITLRFWMSNRMPPLTNCSSSIRWPSILSGNMRNRAVPIGSSSAKSASGTLTVFMRPWRSCRTSCGSSVMPIIWKYATHCGKTLNDSDLEIGGLNYGNLHTAN